MNTRSTAHEGSSFRVEELLDRASNLLVNLAVLLAILAGIVAMAFGWEAGEKLFQVAGGSALVGVIGKGVQYVFRDRIDAKYRDAIIEILDGTKGLTKQKVKEVLRKEVGDPGTMALWNRESRKNKIFERRFKRVWNAMRVTTKEIIHHSGEQDDAIYKLP